MWSRPYEDVLRIIYAHAHAHYLEHKRAPTQTELMVSLQAYFANNPAECIFLETTQQVFGQIYAPPVDLTRDYVIKLAQRFIDDRLLSPYFVPGQAAAPVAQRVEALTAAFRASRVTSTQAIDPFDYTDPRQQVKTPPAWATGCAVFDKLHDGGARACQYSGFLAPYGGGKTALTLNAAVACAKRKRHVAVFQYEQQVVVELKPRILSCATGVPSSEFVDRVYSEYPPNVKRAFDEVAHIGKYLHFFPMVEGNSGYGGREEIQAALGELCDRLGESPVVTLVDWLGAMCVRRSVTQTKLDPVQAAIGYAKEFDVLAKSEIAFRFNTQLVVMNQVTPSLAVSDIDRRYSKYDAIYSKQFAAMQDRTGIMLPIDENGISLMYNDKARGTAAEFWVQMNKATGRMSVLEGRYIAVQSQNNKKSWQPAAA
jgi:hypothetical protein